MLVIKKRRQQANPKPVQPLTHHQLLSSRVFDAIKQARQCYEQHRNALHPLIAACEETVNKFKAEQAVLDQYLTTGWLKYSPTSNHYYIQLAK